MKFTDSEPTKEKKRTDEIFQYVTDERILRVLLELKIFKLRDIQKEAIRKGIFFQKSFLVCAPSGSGKTLIGEICAVNNVFQKFGKSIYLVPFKALATEKYVHFKKSYDRFGIKIELSIGDYDIDDSRLANADVLVTTYEKMDSILRNFSDQEWIFNISTIIIDEIHILGDASGSRGPRLESLIVRLNEFLNNPQIIGLSATIANPEFFNEWLSSLGNKTTLITSDDRPVPLQYRIETTQNKDSTIKKITKATLDNGGQILIFLNKRKSTHQMAANLKNLVKSHISESELKACKRVENRLSNIKGRHSELKKLVKFGVAFHHAGLLPRERKLIEDAYRKRIIKVICSTTTLSAGVNLPSRVVIVKDFKKYVTSGHNIKNFSGYYENGDGFSYFIPFSANAIFQMLGRAGRPGLDNEGFGYLLVNDIDEKDWVEDHYFQIVSQSRTYKPKYNDLISGLNRIHTLKEQVLLRIYEEKNINLEKLNAFFQKTYFWYGIKDKMGQQGIPIDELLMIKEITPINILKLHSDPQKVQQLKSNHHQIKITKLSKSNISGYVRTNFGLFYTEFDTDVGIRCSCGFQNGISNDYANEQFMFEFCDHITAFLLHLINVPDNNFQKYVIDIVPKSVKNQYVLNYLFEKGLITLRDNGTIKCSQFGKLIIRLYLYPVSGVLIRYKLENAVLDTFQDIVKEAYEVLKAEQKVRDYRLLQPILEWCDEESLDSIMERHNIMTGDLYTTKDNIERIITFIGIIAVHLSESDLTIQEDMTRIAEMVETLKIRIHYGIHEELFDLILRLDNVARVRARILYNAGFHTATQVKKQNPYVLDRKTGLGINLCKKIIKGD